MLFISHIKKDVNKILLLLIIVLLLLFAWHSAYYESAFKNTSMQYNEELQKLQESTGNMIIEKSNGNIQSKESFQKDKEFFEKRYYDLSTENEALELDREKLQAELNSVKSGTLQKAGRERWRVLIINLMHNFSLILAVDSIIPYHLKLLWRDMLD